MFNRVSSFFGNNKNNEVKLEPNLNVEKNNFHDREFSSVDKNTDEILKNSKSQNEKIEDNHFELGQDIKETDYRSKNLDLFNNENQNKSPDYQIDLTEIEQENNEIDEKVLEIPAFLRRQAN